MYHVAVIINENEKIHSTYANTVEIIKKSLSLVYGDTVEQLYSFVEIDKFNVFQLFEDGELNINTFDSIFISTNACNNKEIYDTLCAHKEEISSFINDGKDCQRGICISNQQKLGSFPDNAEQIEFLPEHLSYKLIKRSEKSSFDGAVTLANQNNSLTSFPLAITQTMIDDHCSGKHNNFMPHKYRFYIKPVFAGAYETIYIDQTYCNTPGETERLLLLKSRLENSRVVVSSVNLDWAEHLEQIANIMIYITEGANQHALISKKNNFADDELLLALFKNALRHKIPVKTYSTPNCDAFMESVPQGAFRSFVFSKDWSEADIDMVWIKSKSTGEVDKTFYHLSNTAKYDPDEFKFRSYYSRKFKNSKMFLGGLEWLIASYSTKKWRKSIWTYQYIVDLLETLDYDNTSYIAPLYEEITKHYKYTYSSNSLQEAEEKKELQSYDNVFNSTCACLCVISDLIAICNRRGIGTLDINGQSISAINLSVDRLRLTNWINQKLYSPESSGNFSYQDKIMAIYSLEKAAEKGAFHNSDAIKKMKEELLTLATKVSYSEHINDFSMSDISKLLLFFGICSCHSGFETGMNDVFCSLLNHISKIQEYNGKWVNLSSTAELTLFLLRGLANKYPIHINNKEQITAMISSAVCYIEDAYDHEKKCWVNDENITAKAVHILAIYDQFFNYSTEEFLVDISNAALTKTDSNNSWNNLLAFNVSQQECNRLNKEKSELSQKNKQLSSQEKKRTTVINRFKVITSFLVTTDAILLLFLVWLLIVLGTQYKEALQEVIKNNFGIVLSTVLGFVITTFISSLFVYLKNKAIKKAEDEKEK